MTQGNNDLLVGPTIPAAATTLISIDFYFENETDIAVYKSGNSSPLVLDTDYTVSLPSALNAIDGSITLTTPANGTDSYAIYGSQPLERTSDLAFRGDLRSPILNLELDRLWRAMQSINTAISRTFRFSQNSNIPLPLETLTAASRQNRAVTFSADGSTLEVGPTTAEIGSAAANATAAAASAVAASASATEAALYDGPWLDDVQALLDDETLTYSNVSTGDIIRTREEGFAYEVAVSGATDHHVVKAGGVKLYVLADQRGFFVLNQIGAPSPGKTEIDALVATGATTIDLGGRTIAYAGTSLPCEVVNGTLYTSSTSVALIRSGLQRVVGEVDLPAALSWWPHGVFLNADGSATTEFNWNGILPTPSVTKYVSPTGVTSNSGDHPADAWPSIAYAISNAGGSGALKIILTEGNYNKDDLLPSGIITPTRDIWITTLAGGKANLFASDFGKSWGKTSGQTYVYEATSVSTLEAGFPVSDFGFIDTNGDAAQYPIVASVAACDAAPGSCFYDSGTDILYVHRIDGSAPVGDEVMFWRGGAFGVQNASFDFIMENLNFYGIAPVSRCTQTTSPTPPTIYARNCEFKYAQVLGNMGGGGFRAEGGHSVLVDCLAARNRYDGFNYHKWETGAVLYNATQNVEINCTGRHNGTTGLGNNQGSTTHDGCTLLRVGGSYHDNEGENISDVTADTVSVTVAASLANSQKATAPRHIAVGGSGAGGASMYLGNIKVSGRADFDIVSANAGVAYVFNSELTRYNGAAGNVQPWDALR